MAIQRRTRSEVLAAAFTEEARVENFQVDKVDVPVPGVFSVETLVASLAGERTSKVVSLGHVGKQLPVVQELLGAAITGDGLLLRLDLVLDVRPETRVHNTRFLSTASQAYFALHETLHKVQNF